MYDRNLACLLPQSWGNGLAGNPDTPDTPSAAELKENPASAVSGGKESVGNKVSNATKGAVNKVKGDQIILLCF